MGFASEKHRTKRWDGHWEVTVAPIRWRVCYFGWRSGSDEKTGPEKQAGDRPVLGRVPKIEKDTWNPNGGSIGCS